jgi:hypothetical protein
MKRALGAHMMSNSSGPLSGYRTRTDQPGSQSGFQNKNRLKNTLPQLINVPEEVEAELERQSDYHSRTPSFRDGARNEA